MGQAKRRGTEEERIAQAIELKQQLEIKKELARIEEKEIQRKIRQEESALRNKAVEYLEEHFFEMVPDESFKNYDFQVYKKSESLAYVMLIKTGVSWEYSIRKVDDEIIMRNLTQERQDRQQNDLRARMSVLASMGAVGLMNK